MPLLTDPLTHPSRGRMDRAHSSDLPAVTAVRRALAVLVGVLLVVLGGSAAQAHNVLQGTDPADGSTVTVVPQRVTLTFNEPMLAVGTQIMVHTADETMVNIGPPVLVDNTVSQEVTGELPAGEYTVIYRVTSADGHPVEGEFRFTAAEATSYGVATPTATPTPDPTPTASPSASDPTPPRPDAHRVVRSCARRGARAGGCADRRRRRPRGGGRGRRVAAAASALGRRRPGAARSDRRHVETDALGDLRWCDDCAGDERRPRGRWGGGRRASTPEPVARRRARGRGGRGGRCSVSRSPAPRCPRSCVTPAPPCAGGCRSPSTLDGARRVG